MSLHPVFQRLFHQLGEVGVVPPHPLPEGVDIDDRMACAVALIDAQLVAAGASPLLSSERATLRRPNHYRVLVDFLAASHDLDLSEAASLLDGWHAWHNGG